MRYLTLITLYLCMGAGIMHASESASAGSSAEERLPQDIRQRVGVTHVAGKYHLTDRDFLSEGAEAIERLGAKVIKLWLSRPERDYPFNSQWSPTKSLVEIVQTPYYRALFARPFTTIVMVAYAPGRDDHYWRKGMNDDQKRVEEQAFYDLAKHLLTAYRKTGKTFVLQHWEGDWAIRGSYDANAELDPVAVQGMADWLTARQAGVERARREVKPDGVRVFHASEVNLVVQAMRDNKPGVTDRVLPKVKLDLVSYSAWDGQGDAETLRKALDFIAAHMREGGAFGKRSVYVGEYGYPENDGGLEKVRQIVTTALDTALEWGCPYVIYWQVYCNEARRQPVTKNDDVRGFWLIKPDGTKAWTWDYLSRRLSEKK